eukprot:13221540-Alexandrium_andersonii.AAC.1
MLEEHGYTAGCLKRTRVRERRPAAGTRHLEERRARFEALLRSIGGASMAWADEHINEHLAQSVQSNVEAAAAPVPRPAAGAGAASSSGSRPGQGEPEGRSGPVPTGRGPA